MRELSFRLGYIVVRSVQTGQTIRQELHYLRESPGSPNIPARDLKADLVLSK